MHRKKTRVLRQGRQQKVTGLLVNAASSDVPPVRVARKTVRMLRAAIKNRELGRPGKETLEELQGLAAFVHMVDADKGRAFLERIRRLKEE